MHDTESEGAKARDHTHPRHHFLRRAHRNWRVWIVVLLMVAMVLAYVLSDNLSLRPGRPARTPAPAAVGP